MPRVCFPAFSKAVCILTIPLDVLVLLDGTAMPQSVLLSCLSFTRAHIEIQGAVHRFQDKFKHLWDAADWSVRSAGPVNPVESPKTHPGPLQMALSAQQGDMITQAAEHAAEQEERG